MRYKPYKDLQSLFMHTHYEKNLLIDFVIELPIFTNLKGDNYNSILVIIDWLTKMGHYEPMKIIIDAFKLAEVILDVVVQYHGLPNSIVSDWSSVFTSKF